MTLLNRTLKLIKQLQRTRNGLIKFLYPTIVFDSMSDGETSEKHVKFVIYTDSNLNGISSMKYTQLKLGKVYRGHESGCFIKTDFEERKLINKNVAINIHVSKFQDKNAKRLNFLH